MLNENKKLKIFFGIDLQTWGIYVQARVQGGGGGKGPASPLRN